MTGNDGTDESKGVRVSIVVVAAFIISTTQHRCEVTEAPLHSFMQEMPFGKGCPCDASASGKMVAQQSMSPWSLSAKNRAILLAYCWCAFVVF